MPAITSQRPCWPPKRPHFPPVGGSISRLRHTSPLRGGVGGAMRPPAPAPKCCTSPPPTGLDSSSCATPSTGPAAPVPTLLGLHMFHVTPPAIVGLPGRGGLRRPPRLQRRFIRADGHRARAGIRFPWRGRSHTRRPQRTRCAGGRGPPHHPPSMPAARPDGPVPHRLALRTRDDLGRQVQRKPALGKAARPVIGRGDRGDPPGVRRHGRLHGRRPIGGVAHHLGGRRPPSP